MGKKRSSLKFACMISHFGLLSILTSTHLKNKPIFFRRLFFTCLKILILTIFPLFYFCKKIIFIKYEFHGILSSTYILFYLNHICSLKLAKMNSLGNWDNYHDCDSVETWKPVMIFGTGATYSSINM